MNPKSHPGPESPPAPSLWRALLAALAFYTILPLYRWFTPPTAPERAAGHSLLPVIGLMLGLGQAAWFQLLSSVMTDRYAAALLGAIGAWLLPILVSRGLHEDGLADFIDGMLGGTSTERRLAIMKDSRIGAFGVLALLGDALICVASMAIIMAAAEQGQTLGALLAAAILARSAALVPSMALPYLRQTGGIISGEPLKLGPAFGASTAVLAIALWPLLGLYHLSVLLAVAALASWWLYRWLRRDLAGYTGDGLGAAIKINHLLLILTSAILLS